MPFVYRVCWQRVISESAANGDTDGNGFVIDGELVQLDMQDPSTHSYDLVTSEVFETLEELLQDVKSYGPWREWSSSHPTPGAWLCSHEHKDGDETITYDLFVYQSCGEKVTALQLVELSELVGLGSLRHSELHGAPGTGQVCGHSNNCTRLKRHTGQHVNLYTGERWP